ncbi:phosphotransferase enzyme family protein [Streptomyces sp. URMC 123]|uniref:phosphotransferase enzyme family protein n=1 Tax=Streptomyces sp. URMC 123 TaxID=3423403 RepID=UPI003F1AD398
MTDGAFTEARARAVLAAAGHEAAAAGARLLALGENAVLAFEADGEPVVAKIGRDARLRERAAHELRVAAWLAEREIPAVRPADPVAHLVAGHPVSYWRRLPEPVGPARPADLAALLRLVHALPAPPFALPSRDLLGGVERWLRLAGGAVDPVDAAWLRSRRDEIAAALAELRPRGEPGPIHGDALPRNVHLGPDGPVLVDLETFSHDLREHDLVVMALAHDRYGLPEGELDAFVTAYGRDVREWPGYAALRGAREVAACAWVAQHAPGNPAALAEFRRRVASLREGDARVRWHAF